MGIPRTLPAVTIGSLTSPVPAYSGGSVNNSGQLAPIPAASFSISNGIATIVLNLAGFPGFPANGYNGPNNAIQGNFPAPNGQQVQLWGFTTATYFNGLVVTVISNNPQAGSFSFAFTHANVGSTADAGNTAAIPVERFRAIRIEVDQNDSTDIIYVGDFAVSSTRYVAALSLAGQLAIEIASENVPGERIWMVATQTSANPTVHVSSVY